MSAAHPPTDSPNQRSAPAPRGRQTLGAPPIRVLFVEDDGDFAALVRATLDRRGIPFRVEHEERLDCALGRLEETDFDVLLVDLSLPDGDREFTLGAACNLAELLPVVVLTGSDDEDLARAAVRGGSRGFMVKGRFDRCALPEVLRRAVVAHEHGAH